MSKADKQIIDKLLEELKDIPNFREPYLNYLEEEMLIRIELMKTITEYSKEKKGSSLKTYDDQVIQSLFGLSQTENALFKRWVSTGFRDDSVMKEIEIYFKNKNEAFSDKLKFLIEYSAIAKK